jgi:hypothetical protein
MDMWIGGRHEELQGCRIWWRGGYTVNEVRDRYQHSASIIRTDHYHESIVYEDDNVPIMHGDRWRRRGRLEGERLDRCRTWLVDKIQGHTL